MKRKTLFALFAVAALAIAQAQPNCTPEEGAKHVGETATVTGRVDGFHQSGKGNIFLNMGGKYPQSSLHSVHPGSERRAVLAGTAVRRANRRCFWEDYIV